MPKSRARAGANFALKLIDERADFRRFLDFIGQAVGVTAPEVLGKRKEQRLSGIASKLHNNLGIRRSSFGAEQPGGENLQICNNAV